MPERDVRFLYMHGHAARDLEEGCRHGPPPSAALARHRDNADAGASRASRRRQGHWPNCRWSRCRSARHRGVPAFQPALQNSFVTEIIRVGGQERSCPWSGRAPTDRHAGDDGQAWRQIPRQDAANRRPSRHCRTASACRPREAEAAIISAACIAASLHCSAVRRFTSAEVSRMSAMDLAVKSVISAPCWTRHGARLTGDSATAIHGYHRSDGTSRTPR